MLIKLYLIDTKGDPEGYLHLDFDNLDEILRGDDVESPKLYSPTSVFAGDGSEEGFNFVHVSFFVFKVHLNRCTVHIWFALYAIYAYHLLSVNWTIIQ